MVELSQAFELDYFIMFDWYDGILSAMIQTPKSGWEYIEIAWMGYDFDRRIYRTWSCSEERVQAFLNEAGDKLTRRERGASAVAWDEALIEQADALITSTKGQDASHYRWLLATSVLKQGDWFEPSGELRLEGKILRDNERVFGKYFEWSIC